MAALNRTYALAKAKGNVLAIVEAEKLTQLADNHLYHCLLGHLYTGIDSMQALQHLNSALNLTKVRSEKNRIKKSIVAIKHLMN
jgi:RNA polymerase sigma-70 factor (ECF subfamily)